MSFLNKLLGRKEPSAQAEQEPLPCLHVGLVPQWDTAADIGSEALASRFVCSTCSASFTPDEAHALRASEAERLHAVLGN